MIAGLSAIISIVGISFDRTNQTSGTYYWFDVPAENATWMNGTPYNNTTVNFLKTTPTSIYNGTTPSGCNRTDDYVCVPGYTATYVKDSSSIYKIVTNAPIPQVLAYAQPEN